MVLLSRLSSLSWISSRHPFLLGGWFIGSVAFLGKSGLKMSQSTLRVEFAFLSSHQVLAPGFKEGGLMGYLRGKASHRDYVEGELICWASPCLSLSPLLSQFDVSSTASSRKPLTSSQWHRASKGLSVSEMQEPDPCKDCGQWSIRSSMCCCSED